MRKTIISVLSALSCALMLGTIKAGPDKTKVYDIESATLKVSGAAKITVTAVGHVMTGGWKGMELVPSTQKAAPAGSSADATIDLDFVAIKPSGTVNMLVTRVEAQKDLPAPPPGKKLTVIVHSETNQKADSIASPIDGQ